MGTKKKTDWGKLSIILSIVAVAFIVIRWGDISSFGMSLCNSLGAMITGTIALIKKEGGNKSLAIIGIIVSIPALLISLWKLYNFIYFMY